MTNIYIYTDSKPTSPAASLRSRTG